MALVNFDDFFYPSCRYSLCTPQRYSCHPLGGNVLSSIFNDGFRELQRLERELGNLQGSDNSNAFTFNCNVAGYRPDELKVDLEGNELVIQGEHKHSGEGQSIHRTFVRRIALPENVNKEVIECNIDEKGRMEIKVPHKDVAVEQKQSIPIGLKQSAAVTNEKQTTQESNKSQ